MSVVLSKKLARVLRHKGPLRLMSGGYVYVDDLLEKSEFEDFTEDDVRRVVQTSDKQRFKLSEESGRLKIAATQGHSVEIDNPDLEEITDPSQYPCVIHGTTEQNWKIIKTEGISRRRRTHIHFAPGERGDTRVISGMPSSTRVKIYIDMKKAIRDGIKFCTSENNVILSTGDRSGFIKPRYFQKVTDMHGNRLDLEYDMSNLQL